MLVALFSTKVDRRGQAALGGGGEYYIDGGRVTDGWLWLPVGKRISHLGLQEDVRCEVGVV